MPDDSLKLPPKPPQPTPEEIERKLGELLARYALAYRELSWFLGEHDFSGELRRGLTRLDLSTPHLP